MSNNGRARNLDGLRPDGFRETEMHPFDQATSGWLRLGAYVVAQIAYADGRLQSAAIERRRRY